MWTSLVEKFRKEKKKENHLSGVKDLLISSSSPSPHLEKEKFQLLTLTAEKGNTFSFLERMFLDRRVKVFLRGVKKKN